MSLATYNCVALTGGGTRALDAISVSTLADGDRALCAVGGELLYFMFDDTATDAEDVVFHPYKVRPDDYDTAGVWVEQQPSDCVLLSNAYLGGFKNKIINGNFDVWQRGTSQTSTGYGSCDRFQFVTSSTTFSASRQTFTPGQTDVPNEPTYYLRDVVTSSAGQFNYHHMVQKIEDVRTLAGQTATLSFWAKADASKNVAVEFVQKFGSGGSFDVEAIGVTHCALTTSWQKFTVTVNIPSISGKTIGTSSQLQLFIWFDAGSSYNSRTNSLGQQSGTFDIAQVQLEKGPTATNFEMRHIGQELYLCLRYFQIVGGLSIYSYGAAGTYQSRCFVVTPKRVKATAAKLGTWTASNCSQPYASVPSYTTNNDIFTIGVDVTALGYFATNCSTADDGVSLDAEL